MFLEWFSQVTQFVSGSSPSHILKVCLLFYHPTFKSLYGALVGMKKLRHTYLAYVVKSNSRSTGEKRHTLRSKLCECVEFGGIILLCLIWSLSFYFETWLAYFLYEPSCAHMFFFNTLGPSSVPIFSLFQYFGTLMCPIFSILFA